MQSEYSGITALYCRLSRDDGKECESNSIESQKLMLARYAKEKGFENIRYYVDDGYTGTNFNRPDFKRMMDDVEAGYISTIVVKDMSRFGRNYVEVGLYTESYFPENNIRFIAITDLVDSADGENEIIPFKNVMNEMYARDISKKVRSAKRIRGNMGEPLSQPPYGYMKDPQNPKRWIVEPEAAKVVKEIFMLYLEGYGQDKIARHLQDKGIKNCTSYWQERGIGRGGKKVQPNPYKWKSSTIRQILMRQEYCGDVVNFKTYSKSFKNKKRHLSPKEDLKIFKDVHEPIIDRDTFEAVQKLMGTCKRRDPLPENGKKNIFCDFLVCAECGHKLWYHVNTRNKDIHYFSCSNYYKDYRGSCQHRHYVRADAIEQIVLMELKKLAGYLKNNEDELVEVLTMKTEADIQAERRFLNSEIQRCISRQNTVNALYEKLYEDNVLGKVSDAWFLHLSHKYEVEKTELKTKLSKLYEDLEALAGRKNDKDMFVESVRRFMRMDTLNAPLLRELIDHIDVYETEGTGKNKTQRIVIHYRFVGSIEIPSDEENLKMDMRQGVAVEYLTA
ncbi:MAG: recombinase family protein [Oscillospiraceae bacterium]|nr:recombinase family protein [Oscillospiraceae bacterium]MDD6145487.1 recombinase family protein [Oscillospiraceae bacterium]